MEGPALGQTSWHRVRSWTWWSLTREVERVGRDLVPDPRLVALTMSSTEPQRGYQSANHS
jgi:hypothetical protein